MSPPYSAVVKNVRYITSSATGSSKRRKYDMPGTHSKTYSKTSKAARAKAQLGIDHKFYDTVLAASNLSTSLANGMQDPTTLDCISAPAQGVATNDRIGDEIAITAIHLRGLIYLTKTAYNISSAADLPTNPVIRIMLVVDNMTNGVQCGAGDILTTGTSVVTAQRNMSFSRRFKVLKEITFSPNITGTSGYGTANLIYSAGQDNFWEMHHDFKTPLKVRFEVGASSAGIASVIDNSLHVVAYCSEGSMVPQILYNTRMRFVG